MYKKISSIFRGQRLLTLLLVLGCVEFSIAAVFSLGLEPDPKNAVLFGYSLSRLVLSGLSLVVAVWLLFLAWSAAFRARDMQRLETVVQKAPLAAGLVVVLLAGLVVMIGMVPFEMLGKLGPYFVRARPFLFVFCLYPVQLSLVWLQGRKWNPDRAFMRPFLVSLSVLSALGGFIVLSGWGITPDGSEYYGPAGTPLTSLQLSMLLWIGLLVFGLFGLLKARGSNKIGKYFDLLIVLCLFASAIYFWMEIPNPYNEFTTKPVAPYFQPYPASDAYVYDVGALSILKGSGIFFGSQTDKPLYLVFLALLHLVGGYDYNFLTILHAGFMALMAPGLYYFGKSFHSRLFGFLLAGIVIIRQYNAISLSHLLFFNVTPRQFMTEVPTLVGLIFFTWAFFLWVRHQEVGGWRALVAGGILGAVTLIRLNPFLLILAVPAFLYFSCARQKKAWLVQSLTFLLGCTIVIAPWVVTGTNSAGTPYFLVKFFDIINVRYGPIGVLPIENGFRFASFSAPTEVAGNPARLSAGFGLPPISIQTFPGFVINNTLNNFVGAFLTLPDSILIADQNLAVLVNRPYWIGGKASVVPQQIPFLLLNLVPLSLGLGWAWKRWKWAGLTPMFVFVVYSLALGFARASGSRHLVPIDWVVNFYFALGLVWMFQLLPGTFRRMLEAEHDETAAAKPALAPSPKWMRFGAVALVLCLAAPILVAQKLIPSQAPFCQPGNMDSLVPVLLKQGAPEKFTLVYGEVLYPEIKKDQLSFVLLTCHQYPSFKVNGFRGKLAVGQKILAGLTDNGPYPGLVLIALPPGDGEVPQIIWKGP